jgi:hypothetical protein
MISATFFIISLPLGLLQPDEVKFDLCIYANITMQTHYTTLNFCNMT